MCNMRMYENQKEKKKAQNGHTYTHVVPYLGLLTPKSEFEAVILSAVACHLFTFPALFSGVAHYRRSR